MKKIIILISLLIALYHASGYIYSALPDESLSNGAAQTIIYVNSSNNSGIENGSQEYPFSSIQEGINAASYGDIVFAEAGTYFENVQMKDGVDLTGAGADVTVIDGGGEGSVIIGADNCTISGFTITNSGPDHSCHGIYCFLDSMVITGNKIKGCTNGIYCSGSSSTISNNVISENGNLGNGTTDFGICCISSALTIANNLIVNNHEVGIYTCWEVSNSCVIINNTIVNNINDYGIWCYKSSPAISNNIITGNIRGISASYSSYPTISYNNVWDNEWGNYGAQTGSVCQPGIGDISVDPMFLDGANGDYHLSDSSPCIWAGNMSAETPSTDIEGNPRPNPTGSIPDIGAYENSSVPPGIKFILLNRVELNFSCVIGGNVPGSELINITNPGSGVLNWIADTDVAWLDVSPQSGTGPGIISVSIIPSGLTAGTYTGTVSITDPNAFNSPQYVNVTLKVYSPGSTSEPFGAFSTPIDGSTVRSSIPVTGWALDDIGIECVKIYRKENSSLIYIGDAVFVDGARPDIEGAFPDYPYNYRAGWGYMMLTNFLPNGGNGTFTFDAIAIDLEGHQVTLGSKTVYVDNANAIKPFGAIDTPAQGGEASGAGYRNNGWVLTPLPNTIPFDGSTINVYIDGVDLGNPTYNVYRPDIAAYFPDYNNSQGAQAYFDFDTTSYDNGVHIIMWTAVDNAGNADGIGSRYFTINNTGSSGSQGAKTQIGSHNLARIVGLPMNVDEPIEVRCGFRKDIESCSIFPDRNGISKISIKELERLEVRLSNPSAGCMISGNRLYPLPVGSTLDTKKGTFSWIPAPGFLGEYKLVFVVKDQDGGLSKKEVLVRIAPKFGGKGSDDIEGINSVK